RGLAAPAVGLARAGLAEVGEPEAAGVVEDDVVRAAQRVTVALAVEHRDLAGDEVDPLYAAALEVGRLVVAGGEVERDEHVAQLAPQEAAVVADVGRAVGPDGEPVGPAAGLGDDLDLALGRDPRDRAPLDLDQQHAPVGHG